MKNIDEKPSPGVEKFLGEFYQDRREELDQLKVLSKEVNYSEVKKIVHRWKGFCAPYGFNTLGEIAKEIQKSIEVEDYAHINTLLEEIELYLNDKAKELSENA